MGFRLSLGVGPIRYSTRLGGKGKRGGGCNGPTVLLFAVAIGISALVGYIGWAGALIVAGVAAVFTCFAVWQARRRRARQHAEPPPADNDTPPSA
jgi:Flp pilus assembly protein TadB